MSKYSGCYVTSMSYYPKLDTIANTDKAKLSRYFDISLNYAKCNSSNITYKGPVGVFALGCSREGKEPASVLSCSHRERAARLSTSKSSGNFSTNYKQTDPKNNL